MERKREKKVGIFHIYLFFCDMKRIVVFFGLDLLLLDVIGFYASDIILF